MRACVYFMLAVVVCSVTGSVIRLQFHGSLSAVGAGVGVSAAFVSLVAYLDSIWVGSAF
jgi:hypothetical protein